MKRAYILLIAILLLATCRPASAQQQELTVYDESIPLPWWYEEHLTVHLLGPCVCWNLTLSGSKLVFYGLNVSDFLSRGVEYAYLALTASRSRPTISLWRGGFSFAGTRGAVLQLSLSPNLTQTEMERYADEISIALSRGLGVSLSPAYLGYSINPSMLLMGIPILQYTVTATYAGTTSQASIARLASRFFAEVSDQLGGLSDIIKGEEDFYHFIMEQDSVLFSLRFQKDDIPTLSVSVCGINEDALRPEDGRYTFNLTFFGYTKGTVNAAPLSNSTEIKIELLGADLEDWYPDELFERNTYWSEEMKLSLFMSRGAAKSSPKVSYRLYFGPKIILTLTRDSVEIMNLSPDASAYDVNVTVETIWGMSLLTAHEDRLDPGAHPPSWSYNNPTGAPTIAYATFRDADPASKDGAEIYKVFSNEAKGDLVATFCDKKPYPNNVHAGDVIPFVIKLRNPGTEEIKNIRIRDPAGREWLFGSLGPGAIESFSINLTCSYEVCGLDLYFDKPFEVEAEGETVKVRPAVHILPDEPPSAPYVIVEKSLSKEATWRVGDEIEVEICVRNEGNAPLRPSAALLDFIPPGFSFVDSPYSLIRTKGIRGEMVAFPDVYLSNIAPGSSCTFSYKIRVEALGDHFLPPTTCAYLLDSAMNIYGVSVSNHCFLKYGLSMAEWLTVAAVIATLAVIVFVLLWLRLKRRRILRPEFGKRAPPTPPSPPPQA